LEIDRSLAKPKNNNDYILKSTNIATATAISSSPYASPHSASSTKVHQNHYYNEYHDGILEI
jgi:hypothetical protein